MHRSDAEAGEFPLFEKKEQKIFQCLLKLMKFSGFHQNLNESQPIDLTRTLSEGGVIAKLIVYDDLKVEKRKRNFFTYQPLVATKAYWHRLSATGLLPRLFSHLTLTSVRLGVNEAWQQPCPLHGVPSAPVSFTFSHVVIQPVK